MNGGHCFYQRALRLSSCLLGKLLGAWMDSLLEHFPPSRTCWEQLSCTANKILASAKEELQPPADLENMVAEVLTETGKSSDRDGNNWDVSWEIPVICASERVGKEDNDTSLV
ncbi:hypothetical protein BC829DRAFT_422046 [Chytridium lagenaria]|nr:hypothetical protein BC829DRAFT_422046 [Chytridium lagenaria]